MQEIVFNHKPVLFEETIESLNINPEGTYIDGMAGGGGHSGAILERLSTGRLLSIDQDPDAIATVTKRLAKYPGSVIAKGNFSYKVVCDRRFTLKSFNGEQTIDMSDQAATCFINGNTPHKWTTSQQSCSIQQVNCQQATANIDGQLYEAWYSMALPHCYHNAEPSDPCNGLIMELHSMSDDYSLKIKYIEQHIG